MYRLFIDIPLELSQENATKTTEQIMSILHQNRNVLRLLSVDKINYRLGHDEDRQKSNYLNMTESGHVTNKKSVLVIDDFISAEEA